MNSPQHAHALLPVRTIGLGELRAELVLLMSDLDRHAADTVWVGPGETAFERLAHLYIAAGGDRDELTRLWPHYFDGVAA